MGARPCFSCLSQAPRASSTIFTHRASNAFLRIEMNSLSTGTPTSGILRRRVRIARLTRLIRENHFEWEHMSGQFGTDGTAMNAFVFHMRVSRLRHIYVFGTARCEPTIDHTEVTFDRVASRRRRLPCFDVHLCEWMYPCAMSIQTHTLVHNEFLLVRVSHRFQSDR